MPGKQFAPIYEAGVRRIASTTAASKPGEGCLTQH